MNLPISSQCLLWPITNYSTILKSRWLNTTNYKQNGGQLLGPLCTHYKKSMILELRTPTHPVQDVWPACHASLSMNHLQAVTFFPTGKAAMGCCEWLGSWCGRSSSPEGCGISVLHHCSLIQNCSCWTDISVPPPKHTAFVYIFSPDTIDGRKIWPLPKDVPSSKAIIFFGHGELGVALPGCYFSSPCISLLHLMRTLVVLDRNMWPLCEAPRRERNNCNNHKGQDLPCSFD